MFRTSEAGLDFANESLAMLHNVAIAHPLIISDSSGADTSCPLRTAPSRPSCGLEVWELGWSAKMSSGTLYILGPGWIVQS